MKILALEFSTAQRSVAVVVRGSPGVGGSRVAEVIVAHAERAGPLAMIESALRDAGVEREEIECLALGLGPGSYTGVRGAIALAQGWSLASAARFVGFSSAEAIAAEALDAGLRGPVTVVIDAQRGEFYLADYDLAPGGAHLTQPLRLTSRDTAQSCVSAGRLLVGPEVSRWFAGGRIVFPRAARLGQMVPLNVPSIAPEKLEPIYLRETTFVKAPPPRPAASGP